MNKKIVDIIIVIGLLLVIAVGVMTAKNMRSTASKQIEATSNIEFDVFLRSVTLSTSECPVKVGDKTFISIRNVPYSDLDVVGVKFVPKHVTLPAKSGYISVKDEGQFDMYDIIVRVKVYNKKVGEGVINSVEAEGEDLKVDINFEKAGHKRLMAKFAGLEIIE